MADKDFVIKNGLTVDSGTLFVDASNDRVGIKNQSPDATLSVTGTANVSGNVTFGSVLFTNVISANSSNGTSGQALLSNGSGTYWGTVSSFSNSTAYFTVTNTLTVNSVSANGSLGTSGQILLSNGSTAYWGTISSLTNLSVTDTLTTKAISANSSTGSAGQVLTSNGTATYWSTVSTGGGGAGGGYYKGNAGTVGNIGNLGNLYRLNSNTQSNNVIIAAGENALTVGPIVIAEGYNLKVETGGRAVII